MPQGSSFGNGEIRNARRAASGFAILSVLGAITLAAPVCAASAKDDAAAQRDALRRRTVWLRGPRDRQTQSKTETASADTSNAVSTVANPRAVKVLHTGATWYGPGFHGRRTASGERFDRNAMTLASRHLPFGTVVRVVNPRSGKSAVARVNDRGPFGHRGYTVDLSQGLARRIGMLSNGRVRLEILPKGSR
jgi:rare lipoprotein A